MQVLYVFAALICCITTVMGISNNHERSTLQPASRRLMTVDTISDSTFPVINCTNGAYDCSNHGICNREGTACMCEDDYATFQSAPCGYKRKNRYGAFFLQFFFPYAGAGNFFIGNDEYAGGQIAYYVGPLILACIITCCLALICDSKNQTRENLGVMQLCLGCLAVVWALSGFGWWIYELVMIGKGTRLDGNGIVLQPF